MENLGIDIKLLIAQLINFGLFFYVFKRFVAKPFMNFIDQEKQNQEEQEKLFTKAKTMEEKLLEKEKQMKEALNKESEKLYVEARITAEKIKKEMLAEAQREADDIKTKTKKQLQEERDELTKLAKEKITEMSFFIINSALKDMLSADVRKKITEAIIKNSPRNISLYEN